ncbi:preprotein translocase subunit YajC [bacterium BMS3Abin01]|nr:preprotein translocase subunit YajC [bacterium BMS3Abin01]
MVPSWMLIVAQEESAQGASRYMTFIIIAVFIAVFYFLLIRPGQKQKKAHRELVSSVKKGDEVMTAGGLFGTIKRVDAENVIMEIARKTEIKMAKSSIARVVNAEDFEEEEEDYEEDYEEENEKGEEDSGEDEG